MIVIQNILFSFVFVNLHYKERLHFRFFPGFYSRKKNSKDVIDCIVCPVPIDL